MISNRPDTDPYRPPESNTEQASSDRLPVVATLQDTLRYLIDYRVAMLKAIGMPLLLLLGLILYGSVILGRALSGGSGDSARFAMTNLWIGLVSIILLGVLAVSCHRQILSDQLCFTAGQSDWWRRHYAYFWRAAVIWLPLAVIQPLLVTLSAQFRMTEPVMVVNLLINAAVFIALLPLEYIAVRLSLVLPAAAVSNRITFAASWRLSRGLGWRLVIILLAADIAVGLFSAAIAFANRVAELPVYWLDAPIGVLVSVFSIAALSMVYARLTTEDAGDTADELAASQSLTP